MSDIRKEVIMQIPPNYWCCSRGDLRWQNFHDDLIYSVVADMLIRITLTNHGRTLSKFDWSIPPQWLFFRTPRGWTPRPCMAQPSLEPLLQWPFSELPPPDWCPFYRSLPTQSMGQVSWRHPEIINYYRYWGSKIELGPIRWPGKNKDALKPAKNFECV